MSAATSADFLWSASGAVVVNPASAGGATARRWPGLRQALVQRGLRFQTLFTERGGQAGELARQAVESGARWILFVGGDGTFNEAINGLADESGRVPDSVALGFIPSGTGLDLARNLGLPLDCRKAVQVLGARVRRVDLGQVCWENGTRRLFANMGGAGFDGEVATRAIPWRRYLPGKLSYAMGIVTTLPGYRERAMELRLETDGPPLRLELRAKMVVASNGHSFGGGMRLTPRAAIDDGLLDVFILGAVPPLEFLARMPSVYQGTHLDHPHPEVQVIRARRVEVRADPDIRVQTDGEPAGMLPATFDVISAAVSVLT